MAHVIAMAGKGGTGKTTIAALLVRIIKEKKLGTILAVDADPNSNLGEVLGLKVQESIGSIVDEIGANPQIVPVNMGKDAFIEYRVQTAVLEGEGFDLLTMGRPEGPGCYCYVNNSLRNCLEKLINDYDFVIIDNEAGLEHLSRRTTRKVDNLVVISDATSVGLRSAKRIAELTRELNIKTKNEFMILNRSNTNGNDNLTKESGLDLLGVLARDPEIEDLSNKGSAIINLKDNNVTLTSLRKLGEKIWLCN